MAHVKESELKPVNEALVDKIFEIFVENQLGFNEGLGVLLCAMEAAVSTHEREIPLIQCSIGDYAVTIEKDPKKAAAIMAENQQTGDIVVQ